MPVSKTISSKNAGGTLRYLLDGAAHDTTLTKKRVIHGNFNNLDLDYMNQPNAGYFMSQFAVSRHKTNKYLKTHKDKATQCYHLIFSFSDREFDRSDLNKQSIQALQLTQDYLKQHMPVTAQWLVVVQADSKGHKLHTHVAVNSVNVDGKVLDSNLVTQVGDTGIRNTFNDFLDENFQKVTGRPFKRLEPKQPDLNDFQPPAERDAKANRDMYDWKDDLKDKILSAVQSTHNINDFKTLLHDAYGVDVSERHRSTGQIDGNGKKIKRVAYTYSFEDKDGKKRRSADFRFTKGGKIRGLGKAFIPAAIEQYQLQHQPIDDGSADLAELDSLADEALSANVASSVAMPVSSTVVASSTQKSVASAVHSKVEQSARSMQQRRRNREAVEASVTPTKSQQEVLKALSMRVETATGAFKASAMKDYNEALSATYHPSMASSSASEANQPSTSASTAQSDKSKNRNDDLTI